MKVSLQEIRLEFDVLILGEKSREQVAEWARVRLRAEDLETLYYDPPNEKGKIWKSILYLLGVDLLDEEGGYLHSIENFIEFRKKMNI